jgi:hypothetical protein
MLIAPSREARVAVAGLSVGLFLAACAAPALELIGREHTFLSGGAALFQGPLALLIGQLAWCANPLWAVAVVLLLVRRLNGAASFAIAALVVANQTWTLFGTEIPGDEGGVTKYYLKSLQPGFYLWLLSFAALAVGALVLKKRVMRDQIAA